MPLQLQTSFIPKKAPAAASPGAALRRFNLFALVSLVLFLIAAALSGAVFFYQRHLARSIAALNAELVAARKSFEPEFIEEAARLNARIEAAKELLAAHRALSPFFDLLEKKTLESVRFRDFAFDARNLGAITVSMTGEAKSFNAVALQSDLFGSSREWKDQTFSNFQLSERGEVIFNFRTVVDPALLSYRELVLATPSATDAEESAGAADSSEFGEPFEE